MLKFIRNSCVRFKTVFNSRKEIWFILPYFGFNFCSKTTDKSQQAKLNVSFKIHSIKLDSDLNFGFTI